MDITNLSQSAQNPNVEPGQPLNSKSTSKRLLLVIVLVILVVTGLAWWFISQIQVDDKKSVVTPLPVVNSETREDIQLDQQLQGIDVGNLDTEFQEVDNDLNSL